MIPFKHMDAARSKTRLIWHSKTRGGPCNSGSVHIVAKQLNPWCGCNGPPWGQRPCPLGPPLRRPCSFDPRSPVAGWHPKSVQISSCCRMSSALFSGSFAFDMFWGKHVKGPQINFDRFHGLHWLAFQTKDRLGFAELENIHDHGEVLQTRPGHANMQTRKQHPPFQQHATPKASNHVYSHVFGNEPLALALGLFTIARASKARQSAVL